MDKIVNKYLVVNYLKIIANTILIFFSLGIILNLFEESFYTIVVRKYSYRCHKIGLSSQNMKLKVTFKALLLKSPN